MGFFRQERELLSSFAWAIRHRARRAGLPRKVIWLDLGLHRDALQVQRVLRWLPDVTVYGFEANPEYLAQCQRLFAGDARVHLINAAVVGPDHRNSTVPLHIGGILDGLGDSIYRKDSRHDSMIDVPAIRLSNFIRQEGIDTADACIALRMNIEGAELDVLRDLIEGGFAGRIDGWFGRWNDVGRVDRRRKDELNRLKQAARIENVSFNDRDSTGKYRVLRECLIRYEVMTAAMSPRRTVKSSQ